MKGRWIAAATSLAAASVAFGAAAMAQTPSPSPSPGATGTPAATGTAATTGTAVATGTVSGTGTAVVTGTVTGQQTPIPTIPVSTAVYVPGGQGNFPFANPAFERVWTRTDKPVAQGTVKRTWFWGPGPNTVGLSEAYKEDPTGRGQRLVQYFDKSRMELNNPNADARQTFFVTNGLLTVELIGGRIQVGEKDFVNFRPACIPMSGDFGDTNAPTYSAFQSVSNTQAGDHPATNRTGQKATQTIDSNGKVGEDASKGNVPGTEFAYFEAQTKHNIPRIFWDFLNSSGQVYNDNNQLVTEQLIRPWFYASGLPISEPYWAKATISGQLKDVLIQAYERRALTYVPTNQAGFQVEMANIGQHYFDWRYRNFGVCPGAAVGTPTPPATFPVGTPGATGTAVRTGTAVATGTVVGTGTAVSTGTAVATGTVATTATATPVSGTPQPIPNLTQTPVGTRVP